jgi:hypothetical protein
MFCIMMHANVGARSQGVKSTGDRWHNHAWTDAVLQAAPSQIAETEHYSPSGYAA